MQREKDKEKEKDDTILYCKKKYTHIKPMAANTVRETSKNAE